MVSVKRNIFCSLKYCLGLKPVDNSEVGKHALYIIAFIVIARDPQQISTILLAFQMEL